MLRGGRAASGSEESFCCANGRLWPADSPFTCRLPSSGFLTALQDQHRGLALPHRETEILLAPAHFPTCGHLKAWLLAAISDWDLGLETKDTMFKDKRRVTVCDGYACACAVSRRWQLRMVAGEAEGHLPAWGLPPCEMWVFTIILPTAMHPAPGSTSLLIHRESSDFAPVLGSLQRETRYTNDGLISNRQLQMGVFFNVIPTIQCRWIR